MPMELMCDACKEIRKKNKNQIKSHGPRRKGPYLRVLLVANPHPCGYLRRLQGGHVLFHLHEAVLASFGPKLVQQDGRPNQYLTFFSQFPNFLVASALWEILFFSCMLISASALSYPSGMNIFSYGRRFLLGLTTLLMNLP